MSFIGSAIRKALRKPGDKLNILTCATHESFETGLAKTGHEFYGLRGEGVKDWVETYRKCPSNYHMLNKSLAQQQLPPLVDFDCVLSQNRFAHLPFLFPIANQLKIPLIQLEHCLPMPQWSKEMLQQMKANAGNINVFITDYSREAWGWAPQEALVIEHGIDTELFAPKTIKRLSAQQPFVLSVVNDWIHRDIQCGYNLWRQVSQGLPTKVWGATPGLSEAAPDLDTLVRDYGECAVFLNTSLISPVPTVLMEAMSCGAVVVSTRNPMIEKIITHGVNGFLGNSPQELRYWLDQLLGNPEKFIHVGVAARKTIVEHYGMDRFINSWNEVFAKI